MRREPSDAPLIVNLFCLYQQLYLQSFLLPDMVETAEPVGSSIDRLICIKVVHVSGSQFIRYARSLYSQLSKGDEVFLVREPDNGHDSNAIRVEDGHGNKLGYVPRSDNFELALLMDVDV